MAPKQRRSAWSFIASLFHKKDTRKWINYDLRGSDLYVKPERAGDYPTMSLYSGGVEKWTKGNQIYRICGPAYIAKMEESDDSMWGLFSTVYFGHGENFTPPKK